MSATWAINGQTLASLGLEFVGGTFNTGQRSIMTLRKVGDFTSAELFAWGTAVTLKRNGVNYFQGKVRSLPHSASEADESQDIEIVDAWQDLEETIYQENWQAGSGSTGVMLPIAILGRKPNGAACTDAEQIQEAVAYAVTAGVAIQMGTIPAGLPLWQSEVRNVAVAEVIRLSLRFHPDWIPWIDHTTSPPTLHFTKRAELTEKVIDIGNGDGEVASVSITRRDDLKPSAVRIVYVNATIIDGTTYRDWIEDKFPGGGPSSGPRVVSNVIELAGGQMQFQKQRIQTRAIPTDATECRAWLKKKFPQIKDIDDAKYAVSFTGRTLIPDEDDADLPPPINPRATRVKLEPGEEAEAVPRELVSGSIEDWMRRKVRKVHIDFSVVIGAAATADDRKKLEPIAAMQGKTVTATNAITKVYKGITQWVDAEDAPSGIAQSIYQSLEAYQFEGSITTVMEDVSGERFHGCRLNIANGRAEWADMGAMIHSVSFDIASGTTTISVGPAPFLAAADMLDLQRLLRGRGVTWMSEAERSSKELGAESAPGSKGDTVGGFDGPKEETVYKKQQVHRFEPYIGGEGKNRLYVTPGSVIYFPVAQENRDDDNNRPQAKQLEPVVPSIEDRPLDDDDAPYFELGTQTSAAVWLCAQRLKCATALATEEASERLEMVDRGEKPAEVEGEVHILLFELDLEADGAGKKIGNLDQRVGSDVTISFTCEESEVSEEDTSEFDSEDLASSELSDEPNPSDDSGSDPDCPWHMEAKWFRRRSCYPKTPSLGSVTIGALVAIDLGPMFRKCRNWQAYISMDGGLPKGGRLNPDYEILGTEIKVPLTKRRIINIEVPFFFTTTPCKVEQKLTVRLGSEQKEGVTEEDEEPCCADGAGAKTATIGLWPGWCEYGGSCGSTTVLPP